MNDLDQVGHGRSFQLRVKDWLLVCFSREVVYDLRERCFRFAEESIELVQSLGLRREDAHRIVDYVYDRPQGRVEQEMGGVMVTLAALSTAVGFFMYLEGERELSRISQPDVMAKIREKQRAKSDAGGITSDVADRAVRP